MCNFLQSPVTSSSLVPPHLHVLRKPSHYVLPFDQYFSTFLCLWPPSELDFTYLCKPTPPFVDAVTYDKKLLYFHTVNLYIRIYLYCFYWKHCIVSKYYVYVQHINCKSGKKKVLKIGILFSVPWSWCTLGSFEHSVAAWPVISEDHLTAQFEGSYVLLAANKLSYWYQIKPGKMWEKWNNTTLPSVLRGMQGRGEAFTQFQILNILFRQWRFGGPIKSYCGPLIFRHSPVDL